MIGGPLLLGAAGFSAVGPVAGSWAAAQMSAAGAAGISAGGGFAAAQSLAMTGGLVTVKTFVVGSAVGAGVGAGAAAARK